jgi:hypothetical protein
MEVSKLPHPTTAAIEGQRTRNENQQQKVTPHIAELVPRTNPLHWKAEHREDPVPADANRHAKYGPLDNVAADPRLGEP